MSQWGTEPRIPATEKILPKMVRAYSLAAFRLKSETSRAYASARSAGSDHSSITSTRSIITVRESIVRSLRKIAPCSPEMFSYPRPPHRCGIWMCARHLTVRGRPRKISELRRVLLGAASSLIVKWSAMLNSKRPLPGSRFQQSAIS
jgi:hypothetical protein